MPQTDGRIKRTFRCAFEVRVCGVRAILRARAERVLNCCENQLSRGIKYHNSARELFHFCFLSFCFLLQKKKKKSVCFEPHIGIGARDAFAHLGLREEKETKKKQRKTKEKTTNAYNKKVQSKFLLNNDEIECIIATHKKCLDYFLPHVSV